MSISKFLESLMESVDGEGNPNWKRDLIISISLVSFTFMIILVGIIFT